MLDSIMRPTHLPNFDRPPLNEVALGVQFSSPIGYLQIHAGQVWRLFSEKYSEVEEYLPLQPVFETFGLNTSGASHGQIAFLEGPLHNRYWFLNPSGDELIQFQQDRLIQNWRKLADGSNDYPRFESVFEQFKTALEKLEKYFATLAPQTLLINQCEISYINHIPLESDNGFRISDWLRFFDFEDKQPQSFAFSFRETVLDVANLNPRARLTCEVNERGKEGQRIMVMQLTVRGAPNASDIMSSLEFIKEAREIIVTRFAELTTDKSHKIWGRSNVIGQ